MKQADNKVLIIGKPGTSKTTFLAQLFNVLQRNKGRLKLRETPANILAIEDARKQLAKGKPTQSTPAEQNQTLQLSLLLGETPLDLEFPDYGGEQVKAIIRERKLGAEWVKMCRNSRTWLLFIRLHDHVEPHDVLTKAATEITPSVGDDTSSFSADAVPTNEAVELVELLQILLATRAIGIQQPIEQPKLKLVLTLWDELHTNDPPETILASRYPLLLSYARSNWASNAMEVWGLSAQGFRLDTEENQDKYLDNTPTGYAYVVPPVGAAPVHDLSLLFD